MEAAVSDIIKGRPKDSLYEPALADSEREAVADLLQYLENVRAPKYVALTHLICFSVVRPISSPASLFEP